MAGPVARVIDGEKYMWDGESHESRSEAEDKAAQYQNERFETRIVEDEGVFRIYTRRVVSDVRVEGETPG